MTNKEIKTAPISIKTSFQTGKSPELGETGSIMSHKAEGLSLLTAVFFVSGELVGSGVLALPAACARIGVAGIILLLIFGVNSAYSGYRLADCWLMVEERYPELRGTIQDPYPAIGRKAYGYWSELAVRVSVWISMYGGCIVYVLLASDIVSSLLQDMGVNLTICIWILIISAAIVPISWLGSPKDFWVFAVIALLSTGVACVLGATQMFIYGDQTIKNVTHTDPTVGAAFLNLGTILFAWGGASTFPTLQNDMKDRTEFARSVVYAFFVILFLYLLVCIPGYIYIGDSLQDNFLDSVTDGTIISIARVLIAIHLAVAFIILFNPVAQDVEMFAKTPNKFCWQRCLIRTGMVIIAAFIGETVPQFGKILNLVGGVSISLSTFVLPPLFYLKFCGDPPEGFSVKYIPMYEKIYLYVLIFIGAVGGIFSTYSAVKDIVSTDTFVMPCYIPS